MSRAASLVCAALATVCVAGLIGCGGSDGRPDPSPSVETNEPDTSFAALSSGGAPVCEPHAYRECHHYYRDDEGRLQCPMSYAICSEYGQWLSCGLYHFKSDGSIAKSGT